MELARSLSSNKPQILITGHSLGAAVATLCAVCMRKEYLDIDVQLVTFGSPRVLHMDSLHGIAPHLPTKPQKNATRTLILWDSILVISSHYPNTGQY